MGLGCQNADSADVAEKIKPVYYTVIIRRGKKLFLFFKIQFQSVCRASRNSEQKLLHTENLKGIHENTSSSNIYDCAIDQGAMRLGGL